MEDRDRCVKSSFLMKITTFKKEGEELRLEREDYVKLRGKEFMDDLWDDEKNGKKHKIELVNEAPINFQLGIIYILKTGDRAWTFKVKD